MRTALLIAGVAGLTRVVIAASTPLFPDETYYWEWSRHLAAGYFDHPPVIAWLIRAGTLVAGATPLGVRLGPVLAGIVAGLFLMAAARRLGGDRAGLLASLIFALMPLSAAGLVLATPDAPLFAAAAATIYAVIRACEHAPRSRASLAWWSSAGLALGVGMASKYTAVLLPFGIFIALVARPTLRARLAEAGPYVATAVALLVFLPVVIWNARHDWASFAFQLQHGFGSASGSVLKRELDLIGGQAGLVSPVLFVLMLTAAARALRRGDRALLGITAAVIFAFFMYSATKRRVEANWPALAYIPGIVLLVSYEGGRRWNQWMRAGVAIAALLTAVTYLNTITPVLPVPARRDPVARSAGWDDLARAVNRPYAARLPLSSYRTWVAADRYQEASELAFHLPDHPQTFSLNLTTRRNHYEWWPRFPDRAQPRDGMILVVDELPGPHPTVQLLAPHFSRIRQDEMVTLARKGDPVKYLRIWILDGWRGTWPNAELRSRP
jgi:4-amino-4-deoxy-L-arabinose transferase-like glycosyltransferase